MINELCFLIDDGELKQYIQAKNIVNSFKKGDWGNASKIKKSSEASAKLKFKF